MFLNERDTKTDGEVVLTCPCFFAEGTDHLKLGIWRLLRLRGTFVIRFTSRSWRVWPSSKLGELSTISR